MKSLALVPTGICLLLIASCARESIDPAASPEARILDDYLQATTCLVVRTSPEEKAQLLRGLAFLDPEVTPPDVKAYVSDIYVSIPRRQAAAEMLSKLLPQRCPRTSRLVERHKARLDVKLYDVFDQYLLDLVSTAVAASVAQPDQLRQFFEVQYRAIGDESAPY